MPEWHEQACGQDGRLAGEKPTDVFAGSLDGFDLDFEADVAQVHGVLRRLRGCFGGGCSPLDG